MVRRRGNQRDARYRIAQFGDVRGDFITRQLATFTRFRPLGDFDLDDVGIDQVGWRDAEAAGRDLLDARHFISAVARRVFTAFTGVGEAADAVHRFRQRLVRFRAQGADRHRRGIEAFKQLLRRLYFVDADGVFAWVERQQVAQRGRWTFVNQFRVLLIIAVFAALHGLLQGAHHVRVVGMIFAAVHIFQQTALGQWLTRQPGAFRQIQQILLEVVEAGAADAADHALEAELGDIAMQTDRFEQLRAAVGGDGRDPHLGHDLIQTFIDTVAIVQHHRTVRFIDGFAVDQLRQRFVGEVWIDSRRPKAEQHGEVVRIAGAGGFNDDVGIAAQAFIDQTGLDRANGHRRRYRQTVFGDVAVREHQQHGAVAHHLLRFIAQRFHRLAEGGLCRVERDIEDVGAIVLFFHRRQLFKIGVQQDRRFEAQTMRLAFRFAEDVHFATDAGSQRHDVRFAQRVDRRVSHLGELLTEVIVDNARLAGEHGERRVIAHRTDCFLAIFAEHAQDGVQLFRAVVKLFLVAGERVVIQLAAANLFVRQIFERHQATNVFLHPLFIRMAALQIVIGFR
ncbi:conserved hypothetical protein [Klebsiella pneumoniae IS53]|nr:conserved hypothetical protein [Klebsiella pneumoniae IS53]